MNNFNWHNKVRALAAMVASGVMVPLGAGAADTASDAGERLSLEEIVVTARKVEERLIDVPVAITAFTEDDIAKRNIESLADVAKYTAGFSFENYAGGVSPAPVIRGLTQTTLTDRNQNVATFVDGVHIQQQGNIDFGLLNVERIEVLKGPQSSQYGRSAFAGAINYVSKKPVLGELTGQAALTVGSDDRREGRAEVSLPLWSDKLALRVYGVKSEFDGTWANHFSGGDRGIAVTERAFGRSFDGTDGNLGGYDNYAYQAQLRFRPVEGLTVDLSYYKSDVQAEQGATEFIRPGSATIYGLDQQTNCNPNAAGTRRFFCGELNLDPRAIRVDPRSVGLYAQSALKQAKVEWAINDAITATYLGGRNDLQQNSFSHSSYSPNPEREGCVAAAFYSLPCAPGQAGALLFQTGPTDENATSHELRVDGSLLDKVLQWRLGYYHSKVVDNTFINSIEFYRSVIVDPTGQAFVSAAPTPVTTFVDKNNSFFGSLAAHLGDVWTVETEARYSEEERAQVNGTVPPATFYDFTPRVNLKAQLRPTLMFYASAAKGSKAGGFNTRTADPGFETFQPETNWTYELGGKNVLFDGKLQLNYDVFYIDWRDLQLPTADLIPSSTGAQDANFVVNTSGAKSRGVELEANALLSTHWQVNFAGSYTDPKFNGDALDFGLGAQCAGSTAPVCTSVLVARPPRAAAVASPIGGNQLARTPKVKLAGGLEYHNVLAQWGYSLRADLSYQDKIFAEVLNLAYLPSRTLLDLNITTTSPSEHWTISLWGKNVTDEAFASNAYVVGFSNTYTPSLAPGATYGLTARYRFTRN